MYAGEYCIWILYKVLYWDMHVGRYFGRNFEYKREKYGNRKILKRKKYSVYRTKYNGRT